MGWIKEIGLTDNSDLLTSIRWRDDDDDDDDDDDSAVMDGAGVIARRKETWLHIRSRHTTGRRLQLRNYRS